MFLAPLTPYSCSIRTDAWQQPKEIFIDMDKLCLHGLTQYYVKLEEGQKTRKLIDLMDILGAVALPLSCRNIVS